MKMRLRTVPIMLGLLVILAPQAASTAIPDEFDDRLESPGTYSGGNFYADRCPAGTVGKRAFNRFTLIIDYGNHRVIYTDRTYLGSPVGYGGRALIIKIDSNGLLEI